MHKLVALSFGLVLGLSALTMDEAQAGPPRYYCPPTQVQPVYVQPVYVQPIQYPTYTYRQPEWYKSYETGGYTKWNDYHELRGQSWGEKNWRTTGYDSNRGWGHGYDEHAEEHFRFPQYSSPVFPGPSGPR